MILPDYLWPAVKSYCEVRGIPIHRDKIPAEWAGEIEKFIQNRLRLDRQISKYSEEVNKYKAKTVLDVMMSKLRVESPIEEILRDALIVDGLGKYMETQYQIGTKRVDFAFPLAKLVVEADGKEYHRANAAQLENDLKRDKYLARKGWRVLHIEGLAIRRTMKQCLEKIREELKPFLNDKEKL
jgi:very-short-patch-repair endonuclease